MLPPAGAGGVHGGITSEPAMPSRPPFVAVRPSLVAGLLVLLASPAVLASPTIGRITPPAGRQGAEVEVAIAGSELEDAEQLFFEEGRIQVVSVTPENDGRIKATLKIPADCPPGPQRMRIRTANGLSELRMFQVIL